MLEKISKEDVASLLRDKYKGNKDSESTEEFKHDLERLASGEPLAYVIGWIPFLNLKISLDSHPLIPRPETEWWTEKLVAHLKYKFEDKPFTLLDLCAGSGVIGLAVLSAFPHAQVSFSELDPAFEELIRKNMRENNLDETRAHIYIGDLFKPLTGKTFDIIATNPPYIPETRSLELSESVTNFEPRQALFSGTDGLTVIKRIIKEIPRHLNKDGELWMECDISNIGEAKTLAHTTHNDKTETSIHEDQYGRPRLLIMRN